MVRFRPVPDLLLYKHMKMMIFGIVASGKTTLARKLSAALGIPHYEGDCIAWGFPGDERYKRTPEQQAEIIARLDETGDWIVEGTYRESQKSLFDRADIIVFLDTPLPVRLCRIVIRFVKQRLGTEECHYKPTWEILRLMFKWTWEFEMDRKKYEIILAGYGKKVFHAHTANEVLRQEWGK